MASKVNTKFVIGLSVGVIGFFALVAVAYTTFGSVTPKENFNRGQAALAKADAEEKKLQELETRLGAGVRDSAEYKAQRERLQKQLEEAARGFSRAVNKMPENADFAKAWHEVVARYRPPTPEQFREMYRRDWLMSHRAKLGADRKNLDLQRVLLDLASDDLRSSGSRVTAQMLENAQRAAQEAMEMFPENSPERARIGRYRGEAGVGLIAATANPSERLVSQPKKDLEAALAADGDDYRAAIALAEWHLVMARRAATREPEAVAPALKAAEEVLQKYIAERSLKSPVMKRLAILRTEIAALQNLPTAQLIDITQRVRAELRESAERFLTEDPAKIDRVTAAEMVLAAGESGGAGARELAIKVLDHALKARPTDPQLQFQRGEIERRAGNIDAALTVWEQLIDQPDRPLGPDGLRLMALRDNALELMADTAVDMAFTKVVLSPEEVEAGKQNLTPEEAAKQRDELLARADKYRARLAELTGPTDPRLTLIDGKIAMVRGQFAQARQLLTKYNRDTNDADIRGLRAFADVALRLNTPDAALEALRKVRQLQPNDIRTLALMFEIERRLGNAQAARSILAEMRRLDPENANLARVEESIRAVQTGPQSQDPVVRAMTAVQTLTSKNPPDLAGALAEMRKLIQDPAVKLTADQVLGLSNQLVLLKDEPGAVALVRQGIERYPDDKRLPAMLEVLAEPNPDKRRETAIMVNPGISDFVRQVQLYQLFVQRGDMDRAKAALENAAKIEPDNPLVISARFDQALIARKFDEAATYVEKAKTGNFDGLNGLLFQTRLLQVQDKAREALALVQTAVTKDPNNPELWRVVGSVREQLGDIAPAIEAYDRVLALRRFDVGAGVAKIRILRGQNRLAEALDQARRIETAGINNEEFVQVLLELEGRAGNRDRAIGIRQQMFELRPSDTANAAALASLLIEDRAFERARRVIDSLKTQLPADAPLSPALVALEADLLVGEQRTDAARQLWAQAAEKAPEKQKSLWAILRAQFLSKTGVADQAIAVLEAAKPAQTKEDMEISRELGDLRFSLGDFKGAAGAYAEARAAVKNDDGRLELREIEARIRAGEFADALKLAEAARARGSRAEDQLLLLQSDAALGSGDRAKAASLLDEAVNKFPQSAVARYKRGELLSRDRATVERAVADMTEALRLQPGFTQAVRLLASLHAGQGRMQDAENLLRQSVAQNPDEGVFRGDLIGLLRGQGRLPDALKEMDEALKRSQDPQWRLLAAEIHEQMGSTPRAIEMYSAAWDQLKVPAVARSFCMALLRDTKPDLARVKAVLAEPRINTDQWPLLLTVRALVAKMENRPADVDADIKKALPLINNQSENMVLGFTQDLIRIYRKGDNPQAPVDFTRLEPVLAAGTPDGGYSEGLRAEFVRLRVEEPSLREQALSELDRLIAETKNGQDLARRIKTFGDVMYLRDQYPNAVEMYRRVLRLAPDNAPTMNNLAYLLARYLDKPDEALPLAEKATAANPDVPNYVHTLGCVLMIKGRLDEAGKKFEKGLELAKTSDESFPLRLHTAELAKLRGDQRQADLLLSQAEDQVRADPRLLRLFDKEVRRVTQVVRGGR